MPLHDTHPQQVPQAGPITGNNQQQAVNKQYTELFRNAGFSTDHRQRLEAALAEMYAGPEGVINSSLQLPAANTGLHAGPEGVLNSSMGLPAANTELNIGPNPLYAGRQYMQQEAAGQHAGLANFNNRGMQMPAAAAAGQHARLGGFSGNGFFLQQAAAGLYPASNNGLQLPVAAARQYAGHGGFPADELYRQQAAVGQRAVLGPFDNSGVQMPAAAAAGQYAGLDPMSNNGLRLPAAAAEDYAGPAGLNGDHLKMQQAAAMLASRQYNGYNKSGCMQASEGCAWQPGQNQGHSGYSAQVGSTDSRASSFYLKLQVLVLNLASFHQVTLQH